MDFKWSTIQISGKDGKTAGPIGTKLCAHNYADDPGNGHRLKKIGPMRYKGKHFNPGLSRGNIWGFNPLGGQQFTKSLDMICRKQIYILKIKCFNLYNNSATIPGEAGYSG